MRLGFHLTLNHASKRLLMFSFGLSFKPFISSSGIMRIPNRLNKSSSVLHSFLKLNMKSKYNRMFVI